MDRFFSPGARRDAACQGQCCECHEQLSSRLLWPVQTEVNEEKQTVLLCFACVAVAMLRMLASTLDDASAADSPAPQLHRCDRCQRRSRPTQELHGFHLCGECRGREV